VKLYLVRHGEVSNREVFSNRPLSQKGKADVFKIGKFLKGADVKVKIDVLWHSRKVRAVQTAQILAKIIKIDQEKVVEKEELSPTAPANNLLKQIIKGNTNLMIVGHLPFLQKISSLLLVNSEYEELIKFPSGGVVCFKREGDKWYLLWEVIPELIPG
jgi:phosphohistidine phosphatase